MGIGDIAAALGQGGATATPTVTRPGVQVSFAPGGGGDAGGGGLLGAAAGALGSAAGGALGAAASALGIGGGGANDPWARSLHSVVVDLRLAPRVDHTEVVLAGIPDAPAVSVGDQGSVGLDGGAGKGVVTVFTGEVERVERTDAGGVRFVATDGSAALAALRVNQSYDQRSAGQVVTDLAGQASVTTGSIEDGIDLPAFVADDGRSAWEHVAALAARSGFLAWVAGDGSLAFGPIDPGSPVRTFTGGVDVLAVRAGTRRPLVGTVTVVGDGAAGSHGDDAASWLAKDTSALRTTSGSGGPARLRFDPALRSADASRSASRGLGRLAGLVDGPARLVVPGAPEVRPGVAVAVEDAGEGLDGTFIVLRVRHAFAADGGFVSTLDVAKVGAGGGGSAGGLLAGAASAAGGLL